MKVADPKPILLSEQTDALVSRYIDADDMRLWRRTRSDAWWAGIERSTPVSVHATFDRFEISMTIE